ncbi:hypothetical protein PISMIDRAFT_13963 [Pisolithus microcarpus 441]|uniref:Uncharacterized protein n=1 Tax=Pisolithus microcarpus 441 TaxID=765257 RepID=A0A0C9Y2Z6_9AGAM|nr:hypothetical protein PISMIDRAFT_13963 [Pisolithus microcarpus 441]
MARGRCTKQPTPDSPEPPPPAALRHPAVIPEPGPAQHVLSAHQPSQPATEARPPRNRCPPVCYRSPLLVDSNMQESEYFNINDITDDGEDDDEEPPVPRARVAPSQNTVDTVNSMLTDPLATGTQPKPWSALDIRHFFKKRKGEHTVCMPCENMKAQNPGQFPPDRVYTYSAATSNTSLRFHIEKYHLEEFLAEAECQGWVVQINSVRATFSIGYNYATLREVLSHPNISIHLLPPAPPPRPSDQLPVFSGPRPPPLGAGLPPFSISALHCYLVRFIVADDQVSDYRSSLLQLVDVLMSLKVSQHHRVS